MTRVWVLLDAGDGALPPGAQSLLVALMSVYATVVSGSARSRTSCRIDTSPSTCSSVKRESGP